MAMDFIDQVKQFSKRVESLKDSIQTEEATKTAIVMPFFSMLGYDVFNPQEFVPEFTADVGIKKGEKVDYAIIRDGVPVILIECKAVNEKLERHDSQLFRYFGTTSAKFAILTNGIQYRFYTDLEEPNKMDEAPFLSINILDIKENQIPELKKFHSSVFSVSEIFDTASVLKYAGIFKQILAEQLVNPSDEFVRLFLQDVYSGMKTQAVVEKFRPILKKSMNDYISETMNDKIKSALDSSSTTSTESVLTEPSNVEETPTEKEPGTGNKIVTTVQELEFFFLLRNMLKDIVPVEDITYKDTINYFGCLYKGNSRKWICRAILKESQGILILPGDHKDDPDIKVTLESVYDLEQYREHLIQIVKRRADLEENLVTVE